MQKILIIAATLVAAGIAGPSPSMARSYPWCAKTPINGGNPECNFSTYQQCQASISGVGGSCMRNPGNAQAVDDWSRSNWNNGGYNSGWNNTGSGWDHSKWHGGYDRRSW